MLRLNSILERRINKQIDEELELDSDEKKETEGK